MFCFCQAEDGIRNLERARGLGDVYKRQIDADWLGTAQTGMSGITAAAPLKLDNKPVTRGENLSLIHI